MSNLAYESAPDREETQQQDVAAMNALRPVPRISIQAFCETEGVSAPIERAGEDRRMAKAHLKVHMGGIETAIEFYRSAPTPNLILLESRREPNSLLAVSGATMSSSARSPTTTARATPSSSPKRSR